MAQISIKKLLLRTQVGFNPHEIGKKQDLILNIEIDYDLRGEELSDIPVEALNYRTICKDIIEMVEGKSFNLLEKIANEVANHVLNNERVKSVWVEVEKPHALRFAESVSFSVRKSR
ncbi:FolB domain-containing protein [Alkaliflexus imshenetskii]|uniref:FolB domain-containing protein n=1 Tax=Alkaliflexus imshenetskii TaxID=286730 RepID=UPI00047A9510|nr:dihydroneopterin aldolase [Alkaliflexus imshenetskii]